MQLSALNAFSSYLQIIETKEQKPFKGIIMDIYKAVYNILVNDKGNEDGLEVLSEMLDIEHKFFKQNFQQLNELLQSIFKIPNIESGVKRMAT